jgi:ubiquinone biosynthesis protein UbiJ
VLDKFGYTLMDTKTGQILQQQSGIIRTNCVDCLDRTNVSFLTKVVQARFATEMAERWVKLVGLELDYASKPRLVDTINDLWADNGDALSRIYGSILN